MDHHALVHLTFKLVLVVLVDVSAVLLVFLMQQVPIKVHAWLPLLRFWSPLIRVWQLEGCFYSDLVWCHPSLGVRIPLERLQVRITLKNHIRLRQWRVTVFELAT